MFILEKNPSPCGKKTKTFVFRKNLLRAFLYFGFTSHTQMVKSAGLCKYFLKIKCVNLSKKTLDEEQLCFQAN